MKYLVIENEGEADLAALRLLGATDKRCSAAIGRFGSGFKQAIAAALRNGINVFLTVGRKRVAFATKEVALRSHTVRGVTMKVGYGPARLRDWTLEMGQADWKADPERGLTPEWMIVRELVCNALDEKDSEVYRCEPCRAQRGITRAYVELTPGVQEVADNLGLYFLHSVRIGPCSRAEPVHTQGGVTIYPRTGDTGRIFHRGVFVQCAPKPMMFDYDFDELKLSESRTVDVYALQAAIGKFMAKLPPELLQDVAKVVAEERPLEAAIPAYQFGSFETPVEQPGLPASWHEAMTGKAPESSRIDNARWYLGQALEYLESLSPAVRAAVVEPYREQLAALADECCTGVQP
jgi:hypothetical protein